jgi:hypothetical protein
VSAPPPDAAERYEKLRAAVLRSDLTVCPGLGILRRRGLAAWIRALGEQPDAGSEASCQNRRLASSGRPDPSPVANDITRLIAGIIVTIAMEPLHA